MEYCLVLMILLSDFVVLYVVVLNLIAVGVVVGPIKDTNEEHIIIIFS